MMDNPIKQLSEIRPIVLGSGSPRRVTLLQELDVEFEQIRPEVEEIRLDHEEPTDYALRLAIDKARYVADRIDSDAIVIGCDTIVLLDGVVLEKPCDESDAFRMLANLRGNRHIVCSAVALADRDSFMIAHYDETAVYFNEYGDDQIRKYIETGEPADKAGAYGIQGIGAFLVDRVEGNLDTVIGLPRMILQQLALAAHTKLNTR
jgi:septum formation protein